MPLINVNMLPGRTPEQKEALIREVTDAVVRTCDANRESVWVTINETPPEHWGVAGKPLS